MDTIIGQKRDRLPNEAIHQDHYPSKRLKIQEDSELPSKAELPGNSQNPTIIAAVVEFGTQKAMDFEASEDASTIIKNQSTGSLTGPPEVPEPERNNNVVVEKMDNSNEERNLIFRCQGAGCKEAFTTITEHDAHYNRKHLHVCFECKRTLKSRHLLDLHLTELHDSYFAILAERKPMMYACLEESCSQRFSSPGERQEHCLSAHANLKKYLQPTFESKIVSTSSVKMHSQSSSPRPENIQSSSSKNFIKVAADFGKGNSKKSTHIKFGHHEGRFIPRQIFAMEKKRENRKNSNIEIMDVGDLKNSLQC